MPEPAVSALSINIFFKECKLRQLKAKLKGKWCTQKVWPLAKSEGCLTNPLKIVCSLSAVPVSEQAQTILENKYLNQKDF